MPYADVREQRLWYEDTGEGDAVVMLHGFPGTARSDLGLQIDTFSRFFRVIAPDLRGYGRSEPKPRPFGPDFYVQDALDAGALLDFLGIDQAHVLGYSDGAESAVLAAIERPDRVRSVVAWGLTGFFGPEIETVADVFLPAADWSEKRPEWTAEIIANHGAEDPFFSVAQAELIAGGVAQGTLWMLPDVGHSPHTEAAEQYTERILDFLAS